MALNLRPVGSSRKGFFYSISVLIVLVPLIALLVYYSLLSSGSSSAETSKVVSEEAENFVLSIDADFHRALQTSAKSAVLSSISEVISHGQPQANARTALKNLVATGSSSGEGQTYPSMGQNYLQSWADSMQNLSLYYGLNSTITVNASSVDVSNYGPFALVFAANISVFTQPKLNPQSFNFTRNYTARAVVSIEGFEDPLYELNSQGVIARLFAQNSTAITNATLLDSMISDKLYVPDPDAPDFFNRLEGNLSASPYGIETIVNINEFISQDIPIHNQSHVDHLYFNSSLSDQGHPVNSTSGSWLRLDCAHASFFGVADTTQTC